MTSKLILKTAIAPSYWAVYLINGDPSGLADDEIDAAARWLEDLDWGSPVSCEDAGFYHSHDASYLGVLSCDCQEYSFLIRRKDR